MINYVQLSLQMYKCTNVQMYKGTITKVQMYKGDLDENGKHVEQGVLYDKQGLVWYDGGWKADEFHGEGKLYN